MKGADYAPDAIVGAEEVEGWGGRVVRVPLVDGQSTTRSGRARARRRGVAMKLLVATRSPGRRARSASCSPGLPFELVFPDEISSSSRCPRKPTSSAARTYSRTPSAKARYFAGRSGLPTVADDSGLEVDALGGAPGCTRRASRPCTATGRAGAAVDDANNALLLKRLRGRARGAAHRALPLCRGVSRDAGRRRRRSSRRRARGGFSPSRVAPAGSATIRCSGRLDLQRELRRGAARGQAAGVAPRPGVPGADRGAGAAGDAVADGWCSLASWRQVACCV